jgi:hypothetical protein
LTPQDRAGRRARIVRRWTAHRVSVAQREIWRKRRVRAGRTEEGEDEAGGDDLLSEPADGLLE